VVSPLATVTSPESSFLSEFLSKFTVVVLPQTGSEEFAGAFVTLAAPMFAGAKALIASARINRKADNLDMYFHFFVK
jgi:hypothetical protein